MDAWKQTLELLNNQVAESDRSQMEWLVREWLNNDEIDLDKLADLGKYSETMIQITKLWEATWREEFTQQMLLNQYLEAVSRRESIQCELELAIDREKSLAKVIWEKGDFERGVMLQVNETTAVEIDSKKYDTDFDDYKWPASPVKIKGFKKLFSAVAAVALITLTTLPAAAFTPPPGRGVPPVTSGGSSR